MSKPVKKLTYKSIFRYLKLFFFTITITACTRTCVGIPELGSKEAPVRFVLPDTGQDITSLQPFIDSFQSCMETTSGYRVIFDVVANERAAASALETGEAHFGYVSSLLYVDLSNRFPLKNQLIRTERGIPASRSAIVGVTKTWNQLLASAGQSLSGPGLKAEGALKALDDGRMIYVSPESDVGFFVPRYLMFRQQIFPREAVFAGTFDLVIQALRRGIGLAGAVSESYLLRQNADLGPLQPGLQVDDLVVLAVSRSLPGNVVVSRDRLPQRLIETIISGIVTCSGPSSTAADATQQIFAGQGFVRSTDRHFRYLRELWELQESYLRVLTTRETSPTPTPKPQ